MKRLILALGVALFLVLALLLVRGVREQRPRTSGLGPQASDDQKRTESPSPSPSPSPISGSSTNGTISIAGTVVDQTTHAPVGGVTVVLRGAAELTTMSARDGSYSLRVPPGEYRAYVRDNSVMTVGVMDRVRVPGPPRPELAGTPDDAVAPRIIARADVHGLELPVVRGATIHGYVYEPNGHAIARATVRARGGARPATGSDIALTDESGAFVLRVAAGHYTLDVDHPDYGGMIGGPVSLDIEAGDDKAAALSLAKGCIVTGRVIHDGGRASPEGAIEIRSNDPDSSFAPQTRIEADGTFRWSTLEEGFFLVRAWPWKSPPSEEMVFACKKNLRIDGVVLRLPEDAPSLAGKVVDANGMPVPLAYVDVTPRMPDGISQQERTDADGNLAIYDLPAGAYDLTVAAPGRGVTRMTATAPSTGLELRVGGTGRIAGTTTSLVDGAFEVELASCDGTIPLAHDTRLVPVVGGRFTIDDVPACKLAFKAHWRDRTIDAEAPIVASTTAHVELDLGDPRAKTVHGMVRDRDAHPVGGASVTAKLADHVATVHADADGRYSINAFAGAQVVATDGAHTGTAVAGLANVHDEIVNVVVQ